MFAVAATVTVKLVGVPAAPADLVPVGGVMLMPVRGLIVTVRWRSCRRRWR